MKIRNGFVSNSSSSSFILDKRNQKVSAVMNEIKSLDTAESCGRQTAAAIGKDAVRYAKEWIVECRWDENGLGHWILKWANEIGEDNIIFVRESDEGMGGEFSDALRTVAFNEALAKMEYH